MWPLRYGHRDIFYNAMNGLNKARYRKREQYESSQAGRLISTGLLHALLRLHARPIDLVVFQEPDRET